MNGGQAGRLWALGLVLRDGRVVTASGTANGKRDARPETLTAIRQAAERYAVPAELTGTATKRGSRGSPANPGLYPDPGGQPGVRRWDGRQWSPFLLRADPASGKPGGGKAPTEVWSPLAGSPPQRHDATGRVRRAGIGFAAWLGVTAVAAAVTVVLYARDLSKPQADFTLAVFALIAAAFALMMTFAAWARRKNLKKIDLAGKAAAAAGAHTAAGPGNAGSGPQMTVGDIGAPAGAAGMPLPPEATGGFPLPADLTGAEPSPRRRRLVPLTVAAVTVVAAVAVTAIVVGKTSAHKPARELTIGQLRAGDCLQGPPDINTASSWPDIVTAVPCHDRHLAEVYFSANYWPTAMAFPGEATIAPQARTECGKAFQAYNGLPAVVSMYSFNPYFPQNRADWDSGDRQLLCTAYLLTNQYPTGEPLNGSMKGIDG